MPSTRTSFPPLLDSEGWRPAGKKQYPGSSHTWKKSLAPRPLHVTPSQRTLEELSVTTGRNFGLLQKTAGLSTPLEPSAVRAAMSGNAPRGAPLYNAVWPGTTLPAFSQWTYCR